MYSIGILEFIILLTFMRKSDHPFIFCRFYLLFLLYFDFPHPVIFVMSTCNHRLWVDGCFDLTHFGHFNALRQAHHLLPKQPDAQLVVGVHSDTAVLINKGPPVMLEEERYEMVRQCKWTGQVAEDAPYNTTLETLDKWDCGYCAHGDDTTTMADGSDCYQAVKDAKRYK